MNVFEAIEKIEVLNSRETETLAIIKMGSEPGPGTTVLMERCMGHLLNSFQVFFPGTEFPHNLDEHVGKIIFFMPENWTTHDEYIFDHFMSGIMMRNHHIKYSAVLHNSQEMIFGT